MSNSVERFCLNLNKKYGINISYFLFILLYFIIFKFLHLYILPIFMIYYILVKKSIQKEGDNIKNKEKNNISTQNWLNIEQILENGIIKTKENKYLKILRIKPVNFSLKSE